MQNHLCAAALVCTLVAGCPALASSPLASSASGGDDVAWDILAGLTSEVGPRMPGTEAEARAREWAEARLKALGFSNVVTEPFTFRGYLRGRDEASLVAPIPFRLAITALGYSGTTPDKGVEGEVVYFPTLDALKGAPAGSLVGKIAFIDHAMKRTQDGSGYGPYGAVRRQGPAIAASKGALAAVIRSIGTDSHRNPHTGSTSFPDGVKPIPAGAVANPDADLIARIARSGKPMRINLALTGKTTENLPSGNVLAELPGRDTSLPPLLLGCHLDSWDLGTGAIDDAAGCAIITAAALNVHKAQQPLRTIRLLWAGAEELGGWGGRAYAQRHAEPHALAMESDFGAGRVWRVSFAMADMNKPLADRIATALAPLGIVRGEGKATGGTDVRPVIERQKLAVVDLDQDGTHYFDLHHTPDDTLDKVDPADLAQNVAAWTHTLAILANEAGPISAMP